MYTADPTAYLPGIQFLTADGSGNLAAGAPNAGKKYVLLKYDDFPELTDADVTDIRRVMFALNRGFTDAWTAITAADRPQEWTSVLSSGLDDATGKVTRNFYNQFVTTISGEEVADEPA